MQKVKDALSEWILSKDKGEESKIASEKVLDVLSVKIKDPKAEEIRSKILKLKDFLVRNQYGRLAETGGLMI